MDVLILSEFEDFFINLTPQFSLYSYELKQNFSLLKILITNYNKDLESKLILSRKIDLIDFFNTTEKSLLYINFVFESVIDNKIKLYLQNKIKKFRQLNISNIKKYLKVVD
jgi:hypothetical protein